MGIIKIPARLSVAAKPCDYCKSAPALLFCRQEGAFMCTACDAKVHIVSKHARVWMCEVCEQAPAFVTCKADAASLCVACDRDIHSANPLASRHERVPVVPFYNAPEDSMAVKSMAADIFGALGDDHEYKLNTCIAHTDYIHDSPGSIITIKVQSDGALGDDHGYKLDTCVGHTDYIHDSPGSIITTKVQPDGQDLKSMDFLFTDSENYLDFDNYQVPSLQAFNDSVVPVQSTIKPPVQAQLTHDYSPENRFEIDFTRSNISYSYTTPSLSHSVSSSSMDVGVVPDGSSLSDISYTFRRNMNPTVDLNGNQGSQIVGMDREARVLRYKEKRKNRKFEKTIRYASRKAYAETRPRIKGRFAKKPESEPDMDRIFAGVDARYGVVPSF